MSYVVICVLCGRQYTSYRSKRSLRRALKTLLLCPGGTYPHYVHKTLDSCYVITRSRKETAKDA